tara:strand:+ start:347 stop:505 length:159 start_codon:yes stop_codon:yes gene_type:complete
VLWLLYDYDATGIGSVPIAKDASIALKRLGDLRMGSMGVNQAAPYAVPGFTP